MTHSEKYMIRHEKYLTVKDLKEILKNFPDDTKILVPLDHDGSSDYEFAGATQIRVTDGKTLEIW